MSEKLYYNNEIYIFKCNTINVKHCHIKYTYHYQAIIKNKSLNLKVIFRTICKKYCDNHNTHYKLSQKINVSRLIS